MYKILITGAEGQLGNEIKQIQNLYEDFDFTFTDKNDLDITKGENVLKFCKKNNFSLIINCAAYTNVDKAEKDIENCTKINGKAVKNLSEISSLLKIPLIHISTDYVFDGNNSSPYTENDITNPQSIYGKTKLQGEKFALKSFKGIIIRTSWLYSSFGNNFVKTMIKLGKEKKELNVVNDQKGSPTYAADLADAILKISTEILKNSNNNYAGIYHYSNEGSCSWFEFATEIMKIADINCKINPIPSSLYPTPAKRPKYSLLDKTKIKKTFKLEIPYWQNSLKKCIGKIKY